MYGILDLSWWGYIVVTLVFTQITIAAVTIFLHRCQAHRALDLHPIVSHFFPFLVVDDYRHDHQSLDCNPS